MAKVKYKPPAPWVVAKHIELIRAINHANGGKGWWSLKAAYFGGGATTMECWAGAL